MEQDGRRKPASAPELPSAIGVSMAAINGALTELVNRMEREIANGESIGRESANELRSLRIGAEQLLSAQTDTKLAF